MVISGNQPKRIRRAASASKPSPAQPEDLTPEEVMLLNIPAKGSPSTDDLRADRYGGYFISPPDAEIKKRLARRRELAKSGRPVTRVSLPESTRKPTKEQKLQLDRIDRLRQRIGKVSFTTVELIREMRDGTANLHR
jgi:hypothetical protein